MKMFRGRRERGSEVGKSVWDSKAFPASMLGDGGQLCVAAEEYVAYSFALGMRLWRMYSAGTLASSGDTAAMALYETSAKGGCGRVRGSCRLEEDGGKDGG